jgi:hypothetical protein
MEETAQADERGLADDELIENSVELPFTDVIMSDDGSLGRFASSKPDYPCPACCRTDGWIVGSDGQWDCRNPPGQGALFGGAAQASADEDIHEQGGKVQ